VLKVAKIVPEKSEHKRLVRLLELMSDSAVRLVLSEGAVDTLLNLDPPLEHLVSSKYERLDRQRTAEELEQVRRNRKSDPKNALLNLTHVLKRVRNRRAHGFKTREGPRDGIILGATAEILLRVGAAALEAGARVGV
jgi:hypothetical protein